MGDVVLLRSASRTPVLQNGTVNNAVEDKRGCCPVWGSIKSVCTNAAEGVRQKQKKVRWEGEEISRGW